MKPLPRADSSSIVTLDSELFNYIAENLERLDKWTVRPPLNLQQTPAGNLLSLSPSPGEMCLVVITGVESGAGKYSGSIVGGKSTGAITNTFQLDATPSLSEVDGPAARSDGMGLPVNNALICNLPEQYVKGSHMLYNGSALHPIYAIGRIMGATSETSPRTVVYINEWTLHPVICKISQTAASGALPEPTAGGVYVGKILKGQFASTSSAYTSTLAALAAGGGGTLPATENCWIVNNWEQTNVYPTGATAGGCVLPVDTIVWGFTAGFPLNAWSGGTSTLETFYLVYTWTMPQMPALSPAIHAITTTGTAGTTYGPTEKTMLDALRTDVTNLKASLQQLYTNLQNAGYSL